jgi:hypothetical protein
MAFLVKHSVTEVFIGSADDVEFIDTERKVKYRQLANVWSLLWRPSNPEIGQIELFPDTCAGTTVFET